jgi:hypothetical protein
VDSKKTSLFFKVLLGIALSAFLIIFVLLALSHLVPNKQELTTETLPLKTQSPVTPSPKLGQVLIANDNIDVFLSPGEEKVGYFVPGQKFIPTGEKTGEWIQVIDATQGYELWISAKSAFKTEDQGS